VLGPPHLTDPAVEQGNGALQGFAAWRQRELARVDEEGLTYLDYTGAALYPSSVVRRDAERLHRTVLGNPHSAHMPSVRAGDDLSRARAAILDFLNATPAEYEVVLTANASAACRMVGEAFPFSARSRCLLTADNHNSVNGIREHARRAGASVGVAPLDGHLRLQPLSLRSALAVRPEAPSLFAFPAQSNFSGVRHPLSLVGEARALGWTVLLDAASYLSTADLDLSRIQPDFTCLSLYKIAGYPGGVGALVARREALAQLRRPSFAGGTVRWVSVAHARHALADGAEGFEDGTPPFTLAGAVPIALDAVRDAGREAWGAQALRLTGRLLAALQAARHDSGMAMVRLHGPDTLEARGPTVAFSLLFRDGSPVPYWDAESRARDAGIALRGGCFCNPGCAEQAFGLSSPRTLACLEELGDGFTVAGLAQCLGGRAVGALRVSLGLGSLDRDVDRLLAVLPALATPG
jgi:selenocysteine lyase/cysteine desulfurase